jgi:hypothetical protein
MNNDKKKKSVKKRHHGGGQTFDVMRPGKAPADATSRPIVGHKPRVQDPMMTTTDGRQPLLGHHKEVVPALEPAPASEGMPAPRTKIEQETPEHIMPPAPAVPVPPSQAMVSVDAPSGASPDTAANTTASAPRAPLTMQGSAEDVAPVLTGRLSMGAHPNTGELAASTPLAQATAAFANDPVPLAPVLQPNGGTATKPTQPLADATLSTGISSLTPSSEPGASTVASVITPVEPKASAPNTLAPKSTDAPAPAPISGAGTDPASVARPKPLAVVTSNTSDLAPAVPTKFNKEPTPSAPQTPSVAEQIAPKPPRPIKPLPKEAFDAIESDEKKPTSSPTHAVAATTHGMVVSHHRALSRKRRGLWLTTIIILLVAVVSSAWYLGLF